MLRIVLVDGGEHLARHSIPDVSQAVASEVHEHPAHDAVQFDVRGEGNVSTAIPTLIARHCLAVPTLLGVSHQTGRRSRFARGEDVDCASEQ
ncbi:MAG: hypothetical protein OXU81_21535 [Gammaproteobacteria bacterium]|nr:hypothetical protein [Gammaproteobacteria bacterium]